MAGTSIFRRLLGGKGKTKPTAMDAALRLSTEAARVAAEEPDAETLSADLRKAVGFTVAEKQRFYAVRKRLAWLPITGPSGGWLQKVAHMVEKSTGLACSKQYVHLILYPEDPSTLFAARTPLYKAVWVKLEEAINAAMEDEKISGYVFVLEDLSAGEWSLMRNMRTQRLPVLREKARKSGISATAFVCTNRVPYDYLFVPTPGGPPGITLKTVDNLSALDKLKQEAPDLEIVGVPGILVHNYFPDRKITRIEKLRYRVCVQASVA